MATIIWKHNGITVATGTFTKGSHLEGGHFEGTTPEGVAMASWLAPADTLTGREFVEVV